HPFFMTQVTTTLRVIAGADARSSDTPWEDAVAMVPHGIRALIDAQVARLEPHVQRVLETASVAGVEFEVPAVAAALGVPVNRGREIGEGLGRTGQFLVDTGPVRWPDATSCGRYAFRHAFYQEVIYGALGRGHAARLHLEIAARKALAYGDRVAEIAG